MMTNKSRRIKKANAGNPETFLAQRERVTERLAAITHERTKTGGLSAASVAELQRIALLEDFARRMNGHQATLAEIAELERLFAQS